MKTIGAAMPFLSVVIPVYNGERYLGEAIESVLNQPCEDCEIFIANDGSTDRSLELARQYERSDNRIRVVTHDNVGPGQTRNEIIPQLSGEWTLFLDCDDQVLPGFYSKDMKDFLSFCSTKQIETIVPCRLYGNADLSAANMEYVPFDEVFRRASDASWRIDYEFATLLYSTKLLHREHIEFATTRPAEMESIFRHKAAFCSNYCLFTHSIWFAIRRENPHQTTKSWDTEKVDRIRLQEYGKLIEWHKERGTTGYVLEETIRKRDAARIAVEHAGEKPPLIQRIRERRSIAKWRRERKASSRPIDEFVLDSKNQRAAIKRLTKMITGAVQE